MLVLGTVGTIADRGVAAQPLHLSQAGGRSARPLSCARLRMVSSRSSHYSRKFMVGLSEPPSLVGPTPQKVTRMGTVFAHVGEHDWLPSPVS